MIMQQACELLGRNYRIKITLKNQINYLALQERSDSPSESLMRAYRYSKSQVKKIPMCIHYDADEVERPFFY